MESHHAVAQLLQMLDEAYDHSAWHGPNLRAPLKKLTVEQALFRPGPGQSNLWELILHCAYWKYVIWRKVVGGVKRGSFPRKGSDWFARTEGTAAELREDLALMDEIHSKLRQAVVELDPARLSEGGLDHYIRGAAMHDTYHAGQVQTIKKAQRHELQTGEKVTR
jgi:hypothetical protein